MATEVKTVPLTQLKEDGTPIITRGWGNRENIKRVYGGRVPTGFAYHYSYGVWSFYAFCDETGKGPDKEPAVNIRIYDHMDEKPPYSSVEIDGQSEMLAGGVYDSGQIESMYGEKAGRQIKQIKITT